MTAQIVDHRNDVETLRAAEEASHNPRVKTWIAGQLAQLTNHVKSANDTLNAVEISHSNSGS